MSDDLAEPTDRPYCRGANAIFRKLPDNGAECVIDFRDPTLLPSVLFHLNGEYHDSQMFIRESLDLLREQLAEAKAAQQWQSMDTAPRDGTEVLLLAQTRSRVGPKVFVAHYMPGGHCIEDHPPIDAGWYYDNGSMFDRASKPQAWMRLPGLPVAGD